MDARDRAYGGERERTACASLSYQRRTASAAPRGRAAGVAFEAGAVANEREVAAFAAGFAVVTLGLGFGALLRRQRPRIRARVGKLAARPGHLPLPHLLARPDLLPA